LGEHPQGVLFGMQCEQTGPGALQGLMNLKALFLKGLLVALSKGLIIAINPDLFAGLGVFDHEVTAGGQGPFAGVFEMYGNHIMAPCQRSKGWTPGFWSWLAR